MKKLKEHREELKALAFGLIMALIIISVAVALAVAITLFPYMPLQTQYISANLFPLYGYGNDANYNYTFYPQIQPNGTACIQYLSYKTPDTFNYTTQKEDTITTYNATQVKEAYNQQLSISTNTNLQIQIQPYKTLLCPDIENSR
ncbi:MAG: hypothetical protein QW478_06080 [Candidatus Micrarchaeaceae archaeon]